MSMVSMDVFRALVTGVRLGSFARAGGRLGLPRDMAETLLPATLGRLTRTHVEAPVEIRVGSRGFRKPSERPLPHWARSPPLRGPCLCRARRDTGGRRRGSL
jgi:hypothetical protein